MDDPKNQKKAMGEAEERFDTIEFSRNFASLRQAKGLTKKKMAEILSISPTTVTAYEEGTKSPTLATASRIAREFKVSLDWLCGITVKSESSETYREILECMFKIGRLTGVKVDVTEQPCTGKELGRLTFENPVLVHFLSEWAKIKPLYDDKIINASLYDPWIAQQLKDYDCSIEEIPAKLEEEEFRKMDPDGQHTWF